MKIVIDTNVVASAIFFGGKPRTIIELLMKHNLKSYVTEEIVEEYKDTVNYLKEKYPKKNINIPLSQIVGACELIDAISDVKVCRDPNDDKFINCAIDSKAYYIVSGDKDLLTLEKYDNIEIITVGQFLEKIKRIL